jgi:hypothetical protein
MHTSVRIYTYIHFIGVLFEFCICLEGRKSVYVYTFCRCIRVIVCFPIIIMLWTNLRFRHIANALSQEVFQELVSFCVPLRETRCMTPSVYEHGLYRLGLGCDSLRLHVDVLSTLFCDHKCSITLWKFVLLLRITEVHNFTEFARVCLACVASQTIGWWWYPWYSLVSGNDTKRLKCVESLKYSCFPFPFPEPKY